MEKRRPTILEANYLYMGIALIFIAVSVLLTFKSLYSQIFVTHYIVILLPMVLFVLVRRYSIKEVFKLEKISFKQAILSALIPIFSYPIGLFFNYIAIIFISMFGELQPSPLPIPETTGMFILSLFLFAITPGICEEIMFRGVMLSSYERMSPKKAIIITGLLFGLFHFDIQNLLGPAFLGMLFAYMVYKTGSIYTSIIAHTVNNSIALVILKVAGSLEGSQEILENPDLPVIPETFALLAAFVVITILAISASVVVYFLLKSLSKPGKKSLKKNHGIGINIKNEKITFIHVIPIIVVVIIFIISATMYFKFIIDN